MSDWMITDDGTLEIFPTDTGKTLSVKYNPQYDLFELKLTDSNDWGDSKPVTTDILLSSRNLQVFMEFLFNNCQKTGWWLEQDGNKWWEKQKEQNKRNDEVREKYYDRRVSLIWSEHKPVTIGEILKEEFLVPLGISQNAFADHIDMSHERLRMIVDGERDISAETAMLFADALGTTPEFWLNIQRAKFLWQAKAHHKSVPRLNPASEETQSAD